MTIGKGEVAIEMPKNIFFDMLVGCSKIRFTSNDINEFKNLFNLEMYERRNERLDGRITGNQA